jgi:Fe-S-cluster containining protein
MEVDTDTHSYAPIDFVCNQCGDCCRGFNERYSVVFFGSDVNRVAEFLKLDKVQFCEDFLDIIPSEERRGNDKVGSVQMYRLKQKFLERPFLSGSNLCSIHDAKPIQCIRGPFGFFYDGILHYDCMRKCRNTSDWTSIDFDAKLINQFIKAS